MIIPKSVCLLNVICAKPCAKKRHPDFLASLLSALFSLSLVISFHIDQLHRKAFVTSRKQRNFTCLKHAPHYARRKEYTLAITLNSSPCFTHQHIISTPFRSQTKLWRELRLNTIVSLLLLSLSTTLKSHASFSRNRNFKPLTWLMITYASSPLFVNVISCV